MGSLRNRRGMEYQLINATATARQTDEKHLGIDQIQIQLEIIYHRTDTETHYTQKGGAVEKVRKVIFEAQILHKFKKKLGSVTIVII